MMKDREYLRAFRCFGGFMLFVMVLVNVFGNLEIPLQLIFYNISENIIQHTSQLGAMLGFAYTYYLGYRIFIKRFELPLFSFKKIPLRKILPAIIEMLLALIVIRVTWHIQIQLLAKIGYFVQTEATTEPLFMLVYSILGAPIMEELVFRGWLLNLLKKYGIIPAVLFSSLAFGLFHGTLVQAFPAFIIGLILSYLALKYRSIIAGIIVHMLTNAISTLPILPNEEQLMPYFMIASAVILLIWLIINARDLFSRRKELPMCFQLGWKSISWTVFCLISVGLIILGYVMGI